MTITHNSYFASEKARNGRRDVRPTLALDTDIQEGRFTRGQREAGEKQQAFQGCQGLVLASAIILVGINRAIFRCHVHVEPVEYFTGPK